MYILVAIIAGVVLVGGYLLWLRKKAQDYIEDRPDYYPWAQYEDEHDDD